MYMYMYMHRNSCMHCHRPRLFGQISCFPGGYLDSVRSSCFPTEVQNACRTSAFARHVSHPIASKHQLNLHGLANRQRRAAFLFKHGM